jgi:hypothetical protein
MNAPPMPSARAPLPTMLGDELMLIVCAPALAHTSTAMRHANVRALHRNGGFAFPLLNGLPLFDTNGIGA